MPHQPETIMQFSLVGAFFRPPAQQVLAALPAGHQLHLRADPCNPYDPKAIQVLLDTSTVPATSWSLLEETLPGAGSCQEDLLTAGELQLGFLPDSDKTCPGNGNLTAELASHQVQLDDCRASLAWSLEGKPQVRVALPVASAPDASPPEGPLK